MHSTPLPPRFWINCLTVVAAGVVLFGVILVVALRLAREGFSLYSCSSGFLQNAVLNTAFLGLFALPLWATRAYVKNDA